MVTLASLYHSNDNKNPEYWNISKTADAYGIKIAKTGEYDYGGEDIFSLEGTVFNLNRFAREFCEAEDITELFPATSSGGRCLAR